MLKWPLNYDVTIVEEGKRQEASAAYLPTLTMLVWELSSFSAVSLLFPVLMYAIQVKQTYIFPRDTSFYIYYFNLNN